MLNWLVEERQIAPDIPVIDKSARWTDPPGHATIVPLSMPARRTS
jgi:hypothetical protein